MCEERHNSGLVPPQVVIQGSNLEPRPAAYLHSITVMSCVNEKRLENGNCTEFLFPCSSLTRPYGASNLKKIKNKNKI